MQRYHVRRPDKEIQSPAEMLAVLRAGSVVTIAMARGDEPYMVSLNYVYDDAGGDLVFHCATAGKKLDFLQANPTVWAQVVEDNGYLAGECSWAYRCVQMRGHVEWVEDAEEKRRILGVMIDAMEPNPAEVRRQMIERSTLKNVLVGRLRIEEMTGKESPPPHKG